jgi:hypothetical protein
MGLGRKSETCRIEGCTCKIQVGYGWRLLDLWKAKASDLRITGIAATTKGARIGQAKPPAFAIVGILVCFLSASGCGSSGSPGPAQKAAVAKTAYRSDPALTCPTHGVGDLKSHGRIARKQLFPAGAIAAQVCRYVHPERTGTTESVRISSVKITNNRSVERLRRQFHNLPKLQPGMHYCPAGRARSYLIILTYHSRPEAYIHVNSVGCGYVNNGAGPIAYRPTPSLQHFLDVSVDDSKTSHAMS